MFSSSQTWTTPKLDVCSLSLDDKEQLEQNVIQPAIAAIESEIIGSYLSNRKLAKSDLAIVDESEIKDVPIPEGWDSRIRFTVFHKVGSRLLMSRLLPFKIIEKDGGLTSEINPEFDKAGVIVFGRTKTFNGHELKVQRRSDADRVHLFITVKIPDESVFETGWFRLTSIWRNPTHLPKPSFSASNIAWTHTAN